MPRDSVDRRHSLLADLQRGVEAGFVGTTTMAVTLWLEKAVRQSTEEFVDYDASDHVAIAAGKVLHYQPRTRTGRRALFVLTHWGYGSLIGAGRVATGRAIRFPIAADAAFFAGCQAMTFALFPALGETPPAWRWRRDLVVSSLAQHAIYVAVVGAALRRLESATR